MDYITNQVSEAMEEIDISVEEFESLGSGKCRVRWGIQVCERCNMIDCMLNYLRAHAPALYTYDNIVIDSHCGYSVQQDYASSSIAINRTFNCSLFHISWEVTP